MQALRPVLSRRLIPLLSHQKGVSLRPHSTVFTFPSRRSFYFIQQSASLGICKMSTVSWTPPAPGDIPAPPLSPANDIHSHANLLEIKPKHIDIHWTVDWEKRLLFGKVTHTIQVMKEGVDQFILDTSYLDIKRVSCNGQELEWNVGRRKGRLGSPLTIQLGSRKEGEEVEVEIEYSTTSDCTALGWLKTE
jgi:leukotriene-A4 hydrolase